MTTAINPPSNPTLNQLYQAPNGAIYVWDGIKWAAQVASNAGVQLGSGTQAGIVKAGTNVSIDTNGALNIATATDSTLGVVTAGTNVHIDGSGALNVELPAGTVINKVTDIPDVNSSSGDAALNDGSLLIYNSSSERWDTINNLRADTTDGGFF